MEISFGIIFMNKIRLIARIDINNNSVVKGKCLEGLRKIGKPNIMATHYYKEGIDEIIFLDSVASLYDRNSLIKILKKATEEVFVPITIGGGIKTIEDIHNALSAGADKVAINSAAVKDITFIKEAVEIFGSQAIVGSIVANKHRYSWEVFIDNAKHRTHKDVLDWARELNNAGVGEIMITSINNDGLQHGFDLDLIKLISKEVSVPIIVSGGAGSSEDIIEVINETSCDAVAIASLLHYDIENISQIKNTLSKNEIRVRF